MDKLLEFINLKTNNQFKDVKISNIVYSKSKETLTIRFVYKKEREALTDKDKSLLNSLIKEFLQFKVKININTKKALIDEDVVKELVYKQIFNNYSSLSATIAKDDILVSMQDSLVTIKINIPQVSYDFLISKNFETEIIEFLQDNFFEEFKIILHKIENENSDNILKEHIMKITQSFTTDIEKPKFLEVESVTPVIGDAVEQKPMLVSAVNQPLTGVAVAGRIRFITKRSFTSKQKNAAGEFIQKDYFSFSLYDETEKATLSCVMFLSASDIEKFETLVENDFVVIFGDSEKFNERLNFKVKRISQCAPVNMPEEVIEQKEENSEYIFVKPEPYIMLEQSDLFSLGEPKINDFLKNNIVVVFDLETTGLEATSNEIIEIGAVKIIEGKISETFTTLIKPKGEISDEITKITGITNEMVQDAYSIEQAMPDFYKFTRGAVLSAYNISFDYSFLYVAAHKMGYNFNNRQIDTMYLARTKLPGIKNYRLKTVATTLNIPLENAHRAIYDTIATAEVFIKLSDDLK